jgi:hypothetical protein
VLVRVLVLVHVVYDVLVSSHNLEGCKKRASGDPGSVVLSSSLIENHIPD